VTDMRNRIAIVAIATCTALLPATAASATTVPITGTIIPGSDGTCSPPAVEGPHVRWQCSGATETYTGDLSSTATAAFTVDGDFNTKSGVTRTRGHETFSGCLGDACGTLDWNWHVTFRTVPETLELLGGSGQARITGGTGALAGAIGSFRITCEPLAPCGYKGHVTL
jgi:hypothetical protein